MLRYNFTDKETLFAAVKYDIELEETDYGFDVVANPKEESILYFDLSTQELETFEKKSQLSLESEEYNFKYSVDPCFRIPVNHSIYLYAPEIVNKTKEIIDAGKVKDGLEYANFKWNVKADKEEGATYFDLEPLNSEEVYVFNGSRVKKEKLTLKFAVDEVLAVT